MVDGGGAQEGTFQIQGEDDIVTIRQKVRFLALDHGFDSFATAAITTVASELCRNIWVYANKGTVTIEVVHKADDEAGLKIVFSDQGPGIQNLERVLRGGFSTGNSLGLGISGSKKLVDDFQIASQVGVGTQVTVVKWKRLY